jgi:uncharacterized membrane protein
MVARFHLDAAERRVRAILPDEEHLSVFMPCTPNPTTGFFFYLPRRSVVEVDIPVEAAAKLIMSAGMIQPGTNGDSQSSLSALVEQARARAARVQVAAK